MVPSGVVQAIDDAFTEEPELEGTSAPPPKAMRPPCALAA